MVVVGRGTLLRTGTTAGGAAPAGGGPVATPAAANAAITAAMATADRADEDRADEDRADEDRAMRTDARAVPWRQRIRFGPAGSDRPRQPSRMLTGEPR
jgi:hypothetical protein